MADQEELIKDIQPRTQATRFVRKYFVNKYFITVFVFLIWMVFWLLMN